MIRRFVSPARFQVPAPPRAFVARPGIIDRLAATAAPLTVVTGSPGAGKTAVVASWVTQRSEPTVWLSCDPSDVDPVRFWSALAIAVGRIVPGAGEDAVRRLDHDGQEGPDAVASLASDCSATPGLAIVVDDLHLAGTTAPVLAAFVRALPAGVRLVLLSRRDPALPLGRLRAQGSVLELRDRDLEFTVPEARELFARLGTEIGDAEVERLCALTEGWAAGLQLAALSLAGRPDVGEFLDGFAESDRGVADFLVNEVLDLQPPDVADFLMTTSVMESFDATLCKTVAGRDDAGELLDLLRESHLFLIELDGGAGWYRYHHLFAALLRGRLRARSPARFRAAHASASRAFAANGDVMSAMNHAVDAGDVEGGFQLLRELAASQSDIESRQAAIDIVRAWLRRFGAEQLSVDPRLVLESCMVFIALGAPDDIDVWLRRVEGTEAAQTNPDVGAMLALLWGLHLLHRGDPEVAATRAVEARRILGDEVPQDFWVSQWPVVFSQAQFWLDDPGAARQAVDEARATVMPSPVAESVRFPGMLAWAAVVEGELPEAERQARLAIDAAESLHLPPANVGLLYPRLAMAAVAFDRDDLAEAERLTSLARHVAEAARRPLMLLQCVLHETQLAWALGRADEASELLSRARKIMPAATPAVSDHIDRLAARIAIDAGRPDAADLVERLRPTPHRVLLEARVLLARGDAPAAAWLLDDTQPLMSNRRLRVVHGLLAARARATTQRSRALERLGTALRLAQPVEMRRPVLAEGPELHLLLEALPTDGRVDWFVTDVLDAAYRRPAAATRSRPRQSDEALSGREMEVLRYLASRLSYPDVARELYISVNTLKSHIKAIYRKLGVASRSEAVEAARRTGLL